MIDRPLLGLEELLEEGTTVVVSELNALQHLGVEVELVIALLLRETAIVVEGGPGERHCIATPGFETVWSPAMVFGGDRSCVVLLVFVVRNPRWRRLRPDRQLVVLVVLRRSTSRSSHAGLVRLHGLVIEKLFGPDIETVALPGRWPAQSWFTPQVSPSSSTPPIGSSNSTPIVLPGSLESRMIVPLRGSGSSTEPMTQ